MKYGDFFEKLKIFYEQAVIVFEKLFEKYTFVSYEVSGLEKVYIVEDSFVVYFGIKRISPITEQDLSYALSNSYGRVETLLYHTLIIEELSYNDLFKINASKLKRDIFGNLHQYAPYIYKFFNGDFENSIRKLNLLEEEEYHRGELAYLNSNFKRIDDLFPILNLRQRIEEWKGKPHTFILYEIEHDGKKGYAVNSTTSPFVTKFITNSIREFEKSIRTIYPSFKNIDIERGEIDNKFYKIQYYEANLQTYQNISFPYSLRKHLYEIICWNDELFREILLKKLEIYYNENKINFKTSKELYPKFIPSNCLKYWTFIDYQKKDYFPEKYIDIIENRNDYILRSGEEIEYHKAENRWKSEELVYEYAKKLFKKNEVIYQHRPYFLHTKSGQMSYDIFICGENIAIEYQGKQHFEPVEYFGGKEHFESQKKRDELKMKLSEENGVLLVYINYNEDISMELIKNKISNAIKNKGVEKNKYYLK